SHNAIVKLSTHDIHIHKCSIYDSPSNVVLICVFYQVGTWAWAFGRIFEMHDIRGKRTNALLVSSAFS
ncbi:MAG: hypothetical protein ACKO96_12700, partial [Flammeovirgaceae bacterium]